MSVPTILQHCGQSMTIVQPRMKCLVCGYEMPTPGAAGLGEEHIKHCGVDMAVARNAKCNVCGYEMEDIVRIGETLTAPHHLHAARSQPGGISPDAFGEISVSGQTLNDRYQITAAIGKGAMGEVYRATDAQTGQAVAVKILNAQYAFDADMVERFRREGEALQQLRHPNIVGLVDTFQHESRQVIVLEYVSGGSLHSLLKREPSLDIARVKQITLDLCDALIRAHRLNIVHRDIKPENVLMAEDGAPKLTDFGVARLVGDATRLTGTGTQIGTPYYMSPEAWEGEQLDARSDIWSLGVMLYEMLSGQVPFGGETLAAVMNKVLTAPLPDIRSLRPDVPNAWVRVLNKMLTRDRAKRYQSMRQVAADWEQGAPAEAPKVPVKAPPKPQAAKAKTPAEPRAGRRPVWAWAVAGGLLVVIVGGALFATSIISLRGTPETEPPPAESEAAFIAAPANTSMLTFTPTDTPAPTPTLTPSPTPTPLGGGSRQIAFNSNRDGNDEVYVMNADGTGQTNLTNNSARDSYPDWSPDGTRITFVSTRDGNDEVYVMNADGTDQARLTDNAARDWYPAWSPNGRRIAFRSDRDGNWEIYVMNADGTNQTNLTNNSARDWSPAWSPDGARIAFAPNRDGNHEIYVMNADGTDQTRLTDNAADDWSPAWSPDGARIAFRSDRDGNEEIYVMNADGTGQTNLTNNSADDLFPAWRP